MKYLSGAIYLFSAAVLGSTDLLASQNVYGCQPLPADSIFYARVDSLPVLPLSSIYTSQLGETATLTFDSSVGVTAANNATPVTHFAFYYTPDYDSIAWVFPPYYQLDRQAGSVGEGNADHHSIVVQHQSCNIYETYHDYMSPTMLSIEPAACGTQQCTANSGFTYNASTYALPSQGTTDAAGLPLLPLIWRAREIIDGNLSHPIRITLARYNIQAGNPQWPAEGTNGWGGRESPPYGTRFRLFAGASINIGNLTPIQQQYAQTMITALKEYGLVVADIGFTLNAAVDDETNLNPDIQAALDALGSQIHAYDLEAVDLSSLETSVSSYKATGSPAPTPAVMVGTPSTYVNIQAGISDYQLESWVNGTMNQTVSWSIESGNIGTVTPSGNYTPPAAVSGIVSGMLKVTSEQDPQAFTRVMVRVLPSGPIRVIAGNRTSTVTDKLGQVWQPNLVLSGGDLRAYGGDYPGWPTPANAIQATQLPIYQSFAYTYGNDLVTNLIVPNGTYNLRLMFGEPYDGRSPQGCTFPATLHAPMLIEAQYQPVAYNYDFGAEIDHKCGIPVDFNTRVKVTNMLLEFAIRNATPLGNVAPGSPIVSGFEIVPD